MTNLFFSTNAAFILNPQPDLSGNPFLRVLKFSLMEIVGKKDWEWKAEIAAQINILINPKNRIKPMRFLVVVGMFVNPIQLRLAVVCEFCIDGFFHFESGF